MSKHFDSFYESWHGHPRRKRIYDWTIRRYIEIIAIDIGRAPSLSIPALYHPVGAREKFGVVDCAIIDCLLHHKRLTSAELADLTSFHVSAIHKALRNRPQHFVIVAQITKKGGNNDIRKVNVWGLKHETLPNYDR